VETITSLDNYSNRISKFHAENDDLDKIAHISYQNLARFIKLSRGEAKGNRLTAFYFTIMTVYLP
jgi:hypothetical protein